MGETSERTGSITCRSLNLGISIVHDILDRLQCLVNFEVECNRVIEQRSLPAGVLRIISEYTLPVSEPDEENEKSNNIRVFLKFISY